MEFPLSASQVNRWLRCPRSYYLHYVARIPPEFTAVPLALGSAVHSAIAWWHDEKIAGRTPANDDVLQVFAADWEAENENDVRYQGDETPASVGAVGEQLVQIYVARMCDEPIIASEVPFEIDVPSGDGYQVKGYFDAVAAGHRLIEIKTSSRRPSPVDLELRPQLGIYRAAYEQIHGVEPDVLVVTLLKHKKPAIEITPVPPIDGAFFLGVVRDVGRAIDSGSFPANPSIQNCPRCEHRRACDELRAMPDTRSARGVDVAA
jgi:CRISPR/Cas system-associated exonuclease Cas4 (RecB family)